VLTSRTTAKPPEITSSARGIVSVAMVKSLAESGSRSLTVETSSRDNAETAIRVGNSGVAQHLPKFTATCGK
jgi:hypothetical protein